MDTWGIRSVSLYCGFVLIRRLRSPAKQSATTYGVGRLVLSCSSPAPSLHESAILVLDLNVSNPMSNAVVLNLWVGTPGGSPRDSGGVHR